MRKNADNVKLLLISNRCISKSDANGRSLLNLLSSFSSDSLYQIYTAGDVIDPSLCCDHFKLSNRDAVRGLIGKRPAKPVTDPNAEIVSGAPSRAKKTALTMLLRDIVWCNSRGVDRALVAWLEDVRPDAILLQLGDSSNLIHIAHVVAKHFDIPIVVYNTEEYYFKEYDYMKANGRSNFIYRLFRRSFVKNVRRLFKNANRHICSCDGLKAIYDSEFSIDSEVLYTASALTPISFDTAEQNTAVSYCGNLGVGRHRSLIRISEVLQELDDTLRVDVYGNAPTDQVERELLGASGINFHGPVTYETVLDVMSKSRLLLHAEGFDPYITMDTKYAFSTKIADCAASGVPFLIYAPETCEGLRYVRDNEIGFTVTADSELKGVLRRALFDADARAITVGNAVNVVRSNHNIKTNGDRVMQIILSAVNHKS